MTVTYLPNLHVIVKCSPEGSLGLIEELQEVLFSLLQVVFHQPFRPVRVFFPDGTENISVVLKCQLA